MEFVTNEKLTIVGAAGMIGSNMASNLFMYFRWSRSILQSELLMMLSLTTGEEMMSSTSCVTTIASQIGRAHV